MSDQAPQDQQLRELLNQGIAQPTEGETPEAETGETDYKALAEKYKALSRTQEARAKANFEKAQKYDELQERDKSDLQRAVEAQQRAEKDAADVRTELDRRDVAIATGVPLELVKGTTREEMEESAKALLAWVGNKKGASGIPGQGAQGSAVGSSDDPNAWLRGKVFKGVQHRSMYS